MLHVGNEATPRGMLHASKNNDGGASPLFLLVSLSLTLVEAVPILSIYFPEKTYLMFVRHEGMASPTTFRR